MADFQGVSLADYRLNHILSGTDILEIAIELTDILDLLHQQQLVHKDIKPANISIDPITKQVQLIDGQLTGTLAYMSPEQTGRIDRQIDRRSDFYNLGVTLYELFAGKLPFDVDANRLSARAYAEELIYCHLTRIAIPVHKIDRNLPPMISAVVAKLMTKSVEDRYQTAIGIKSDLLQCLQQWQRTGTIAEFAIAQSDLNDRLLSILAEVSRSNVSIDTPIDLLATLATITHSLNSNTPSNPSVHSADLVTIFKDAQALGSIIDLPELIYQFCQILLKNSGATTCIPILLRHDALTQNQTAWEVYTVEFVDSIYQLHCSPLAESSHLPLKAIDLVRHHHQTIIIGANLDRSLLTDEYLRRHQPQSAMCVPLLHRGELRGIVYLENRHTADLFTLDRQIAIEFIAAQAVNALYNAQLYESISQRSAAMDAALDGMAIIEKDGKFIYLNRSYAQMYGYGVDELIGQNWRYLYSLELIAEFEQIVCATLTSDRQWRGITLSTRKDGSTFDREVTLFLLANGRLISICRDVTAQQTTLRERDRAEIALKQSQQKYYNLLQSVNGVVWEYDLHIDRFTFVSDRAIALFGYPIADWLEQPDFWQQHIYPEDRDATIRTYDEAIAYCYNCEFEYRMVTADNRVIWIYDISTLIRNPDGQPIATTGLFIDISDLKQVESKLSQTNEQLAATNEELQRATRLKDEFLATMSHELRTPLNAILGMSEALQEEVFGKLDPRQLNSISTIEQSGRHLLSLINDILDVSKISAGKLELNITTVSLAELCRSSLMLVKPQAFKKQIEIDLHIGADIDTIYVDERRIRQVLINLLNNAVKFTPDRGFVTLSVEMGDGSGEMEEDKSYICFTVRDSGIGIAPADLAKLFQPFIQVDSNLNRKYEGTGLGLVLVKQIVELHGGSITIDSQVGKGSCFNVILPYHRTHPILPAHPNLPPASPSVKLPTSATILLVEDNEVNINTFSSYLTAKGYQMIVARDGVEAISILANCANALTDKHHPNLILMDIQMREMDGFTAISHIRSQSAFQRIPIIALTALVSAEDCEKCLASGANRYLTKPVKMKELHHTIQECLN